MTKICSKCKIEKPLENFYADNRHKDGKQSHCMRCFKFYKEINYDNTKDNYKKRARKSRLKRTYGITEKEWQTMFKNQGGKCALCNKDHKEMKTKMHTEHNHKSGKIRALVCFYCNVFRIGKLNLEWSKKVYEYMLKYDG